MAKEKLFPYMNEPINPVTEGQFEGGLYVSEQYSGGLSIAQHCMIEFMKHAPSEIPEWFTIEFPKKPERPETTKSLQKIIDRAYREVPSEISFKLQELIDFNHVNPSDVPQLQAHINKVNQHKIDLEEWMKDIQTKRYFAWKRYHAEMMLKEMDKMEIEL